MGAGKTTLARQLSSEYVDSDEYIAKKVNLKVPDFIEKFGISEFRKLEEEVLPELIGSYPVIATGGGIIESEKNRELLRKEKNVIYLKADFETLVERLKKDSENVRPLFENIETLKKRYEERLPIYEELANLTIDTSQLSLDELKERMKKEIEDDLKADVYCAIIFVEKFERWGLRGDPDFWEHLAKMYAEVKLPYASEIFEKELLAEFKSLTGHLPTRNECHRVEQFSQQHKGMSAGMLSADFWLDKGIPTLVERLDKANKALIT